MCGGCGAALAPTAAPLELVLPGAGRVPLVGEVTIGRAPECTVRLADPSVSRTHARILADGPGGDALVEDAGSSHGTYLDGERVAGPRPLRDGALLQVGDQRLGVERRRDPAAAGRTLVVPARADEAAAERPLPGGTHPRLRPGYALKRLDVTEGARRWVLQDLGDGGFLRLGDEDAELLGLLDGSNTVPELLARAEERSGATAGARLARLLADLGDRGLLDGVEGTAPAAPPGRLRRLLTPREWATDRLGPAVERAYRAGGWLVFTRPAIAVVAALGVVGIAVFGFLVAERYGTPFVVADRLVVGGLVFLAGRLAIVVVHEGAHALALASVGRRVRRAGLKLLLVFPFAFVDTSEAWFEARRRRMLVSAAGPVSDLALAGLAAIGCLLLEGTVRDVLFQVAFAAYLGALLNLNPLLERDGYHVLVDVLREPGLRKRAKDQFEGRLSGRGPGEGSRVLARYSVFGLLWGVAGACFAIFMIQRFGPAMKAVAPDLMVDVIMYSLAVIVFVPVLLVIVKPLFMRFRGAPA